MRCLGLDIGSSSIKGAVLDLDTGTVHSIVKEPFPAPLSGLPTGWYEIDPLEVARRTQRVIEQLLVIAPDSKSVFFCGQMGGVVLVDANNRPVTNYLSWRDQRTLSPHPGGGDFLQEIQRHIGLLHSFDGDTSSANAPCSLMTQLGNELKPGSATSLLFWLRESAQLPPGARPSTIGDFVITHLSGNLPRMEQTQAIGLVDLQLNAGGMLRSLSISVSTSSIGARWRGSISRSRTAQSTDTRSLSIQLWETSSVHCEERA
ncbi:MAG: FGGY family carbohydrate kinase [Planctomycetaceae bacterium]